MNRLITLALLCLLLAACAPDNLDITPTAVPTEVPTATPTREPGQAASTSVPVSADRLLVEYIVTSIPASVSAGAVTWQRISAEPLIEDVEGGVLGKVEFTERGGGQANLSYGVFDSPESAQAYYDEVAGRVRTLEQAETRDNFPTPNLFGGGLYGADSIFAMDNIYLRVSVPLFSSTAGNPLPTLSRQALDILEAALASFAGGGDAAAVPTEATTEAAAEATEAVAAGGTDVAALAAAMPDSIQLWNKTNDSPIGTVDTMTCGQITENRAMVCYVITGGGGEAAVLFTVLGSPEEAQAYYDEIAGLRRTLESGESRDNFPTPNLFAGGTYGWAALVLQGNVIVEISVPRVSSTMGDPLPSLARRAVAALGE